MAERSRTYNSIVNSLYGIGASIIVTILNFIVRIVLVKELGEEINGLHNLFQSVISVMTLMEMGISTAMIIHLYAPVKEGDTVLIKGILRFYKIVYSGIAGVFSLVSVFITLFVLDNLIETTIDSVEVKIYFLLFTLAFTFNYLLYYKRSILYAEQRNRVSIAVVTICELFFRGLQIVLLCFYHQYYLFLVLTILEKISANIICNRIVTKEHPYLKDNKEVLPVEKKKAIFTTIKPLFVNQMANTVQLSSRSILISMLLGNISIVGYFGNYQLITNVVQIIYGQFGGAFTSSFGNLAVEKNIAKMQHAYYKSSFIMNWIAIICCSCFIACVQDFILFVFGPQFVLDIISVFILTVNLVIYLLNIPMISIQNAMGLHRYDSLNMVIQAVLAIVMGYCLGRIWGMPGIFIGLLLPLIIFTFIIKGILISNKALQISSYKYLKYILFELFKAIVCVFIIYYICHLIVFSNLLVSIAVKLVIALILAILIPCCFSLKSSELQETINLIKRKRV